MLRPLWACRLTVMPPPAGPEEKAPQPWPVLAEPIRSRSGRHLIPVTPSPEGDADNQAAGQRASGPRSTAGSERSYSPERRSSGRRPVASSSGSHRGVSTGSSRDAFDAAIMAARAWEAAEDDRVTSHAAAGPSRVAGQSSGAKRRAKAAASGIADLSADGGGLASAAAFADSTGEQADSTSSPAEQRGASAASAKQPPLMPQRGSPPADNTHKHNSPSAESSAATAKTPSLADRLAKQEAAIAAAAAGPVTPPKAVERQAIAVVAAVNAGAISGAVVAAAPPLVSPSPERGGDSVPAAGEGGGSAAGAGADIAPETDSSMRGFYKVGGHSLLTPSLKTTQTAVAGLSRRKSSCTPSLALGPCN